MSKKLVIDIGKMIKFIAIILIVILVLVFIFVNTRNFIGNKKFEKDLLKISEQNKDAMFKISKIILYSSAYTIDNSDRNLLQDLDIHHFTDIAIYIDNTSYVEHLSSENTIKEVYIDNINIDSESELGEKFLNYKNPLKFGKFEFLDNTERIDFEIIRNNIENTEINYDNPVFFTDCSNPIALGYVNQNIMTHFNIEEDNRQVAFDGSILRKANISMYDLACRISFDLHIKNNLDEEYICNIVIDNISGNSDIYNGYTAMEYTPTGLPYNFFKLVF